MPDAALAGPGRSGSAFVYVTFLPSHFGPGYTAGIRGWEGNYDPVDGWADGTYYRLAGVARVPAPVSRYCCPQWHKAARRLNIERAGSEKIIWAVPRNA